MVQKFIIIFNILILSVFVSCTHLFYQPDSNIYMRPENLNLSFEEYYWETPDHIYLHALHLKSKLKEKKGLILQFHGNAENLSSHFVALAWVVSHGYDLIAFDYRGYGKSSGEPSQAGVNLDALTALNKAYEIVEKEKLGKFIVYGQSLGGIVSMRSIFDFDKRSKIDLVVMESTFSSYKKIAFDKLTDQWFLLPLSPLAFVLVSDKTASKPFLKNLDRPLLVIHGDSDPVIPLKFGEEIFNSTPKDLKKDIWKISGGHHIDSFWVENGKYRKDLLDYMDRI